MLVKPDQVIVTHEENAWQAHHRDYPEVRAEGDSPRRAANYLAKRLEFDVSGALYDWRSTDLELALADVRAFVERSSP